MWLTLEDGMKLRKQLTAGPAAKTARLPMRSPGTVCKGRGEVLFYNSNTTDDSISSQGAGMYTGYRVGSILSFRPPV